MGVLEPLQVFYIPQNGARHMVAGVRCTLPCSTDHPVKVCRGLTPGLDSGIFFLLSLSPPWGKWTRGSPGSTMDCTAAAVQAVSHRDLPRGSWARSPLAPAASAPLAHVKHFHLRESPPTPAGLCCMDFPLLK